MSNQKDKASLSSIDELAKLFYVIHQKLFGDADLLSLTEEYEKKRDEYLKGHDSLELRYPDPGLRLNKFESFLRSHASRLAKADEDSSSC